MDVNDIIKVMNAQNEKASSLSLSKGGFEGSIHHFFLES